MSKKNCLLAAKIFVYIAVFIVIGMLMMTTLLFFLYKQGKEEADLIEEQERNAIKSRPDIKQQQKPETDLFPPVDRRMNTKKMPITPNLCKNNEDNIILDDSARDFTSVQVKKMSKIPNLSFDKTNDDNGTHYTDANPNIHDVNCSVSDRKSSMNNQYTYVKPDFKSQIQQLDMYQIEKDKRKKYAKTHAKKNDRTILKFENNENYNQPKTLNDLINNTIRSTTKVHHPSGKHKDLVKTSNTNNSSKFALSTLSSDHNKLGKKPIDISHLMDLQSELETVYNNEHVNKYSIDKVNQYDNNIIKNEQQHAFSQDTKEEKQRDEKIPPVHEITQDNSDFYQVVTNIHKGNSLIDNDPYDTNQLNIKYDISKNNNLVDSPGIIISDLNLFEKNEKRLRFDHSNSEIVKSDKDESLTKSKLSNGNNYKKTNDSDRQKHNANIAIDEIIIDTNAQVLVSENISNCQDANESIKVLYSVNAEGMMCSDISVDILHLDADESQAITEINDKNGINLIKKEPPKAYSIIQSEENSKYVNFEYDNNEQNDEKGFIIESASSNIDDKIKESGLLSRSNSNKTMESYDTIANTIMTGIYMKHLDESYKHSNSEEDVENLQLTEDLTKNQQIIPLKDRQTDEIIAPIVMASMNSATIKCQSINETTFTAPRNMLYNIDLHLSNDCNAEAQEEKVVYNHQSEAIFKLGMSYDNLAQYGDSTEVVNMECNEISSQNDDIDSFVMIDASSDTTDTSSENGKLKKVIEGFKEIGKSLEERNETIKEVIDEIKKKE